MADLFNRDQPELFDYKPKYPETPGYKQHGTSKDAAKAIEPRAPSLRDMALDAIKRAGPRGLTPDQVASLLRKTVLAIRPRISELKEMGKIVQTGERRENASGVKADVWRAVDDQ